ncbi:MAG TPA: multicopper oxidase family protein [Candidatus Thermoplasmatota archaeon]|nr:multicopper oxidase family protein [Candidatus Thermoplasmatota archaeon]
MLPRVLVLAVLAATLSAGCFGSGGLLGAASEEGPARRADAMLARPPGSDVRETGQVRDFDLYLQRTTHEVYPGASMAMWGFSLSPDGPFTVPGPTLRVTEGDRVVVRLNVLFAGFNHTLHFHGQNVPADMDGVPFVSQAPAEPNQPFEYSFIAKPAGTYWYHCHVDAQHHIDMGMYGMLIVDPQDPAADPRYDGEFVLILDDMDRYHLEGGQPAGNNLPQNGDPMSYEEWLRRQAGDTLNRNPAVSDRVTGTPLRPTRNWTPVTYAPYSADYNTFLINGMAFPYTQPLVVEEGKVYRLRTLNAGNTMMSLHLHGHHMLVTHKDGVLLDAPYWVDTLILGPSERYDLYLKADNPGMWDLHDHFGDHTQNDGIFPGGAMTMLCYASVEGCSTGSGGHHHARHRRSGDLVNAHWMEMARGLP